MKLRSLKGSQRVPRVPFRIEGTLKININQSIVPSVPLVPSNISLACAREKRHITNNAQNPQIPCNLEGTEGTKGTRGLKIAVFWYPLPEKVPSTQEKYPFLQEACL
jgi:hypothetical protein